MTDYTVIDPDIVNLSNKLESFCRQWLYEVQGQDTRKSSIYIDKDDVDIALAGIISGFVHALMVEREKTKNLKIEANS